MLFADVELAKSSAHAPGSLAGSSELSGAWQRCAWTRHVLCVHARLIVYHMHKSALLQGVMVAWRELWQRASGQQQSWSMRAPSLLCLWQAQR